MSEIKNIEEISEVTFNINLKLIQQHQQAEPFLMVKYEDGKYHTFFSHGGRNKNLSLITYKDKIVISPKITKLRISLVPYVFPSSRNG